MKFTNSLEVKDDHNEIHWLILQQIDALSEELDSLVENDVKASLEVPQTSPVSTLFVRSKSILLNKYKTKTP